MSSILVGLSLAAFGLLCHWRGARALPYAAERAEFVPANLLVQAAAMAWLLPAIPPLHAVALLFLQLTGLSVIAFGSGIGIRMPRCRDTVASRAPQHLAEGVAATGWQIQQVRSGS